MRNLWPAALGLIVFMFCFGTAVAVAEPVDDYNTALKFYEQKRWNFATRGFEDFLEQAPNHPKAPLAQLYLGQSLTHSQKYDAARGVFRKFLAAHPQHTDAPLAAYRIGESSYFLGEPDAANKELEFFVKTYPQHDLAVWGWQYLGEIRLQLKDAPGAIQAFEEALKLKTDATEQIETKFFLAQAYESMQKNELATALYKEVAAANHPRAAEALFGLASAEYEAKRFDTAAKQFEDLIARFGKHPLAATAELNAGFSLYQSGDFEKAEKHFEAAAKTPTNINNATFWIGMSRKSRSDWAGATQVFEALAAKIPPGEQAEKTTYHWADCESRLEHFEQAQKLFLGLFEKWPNSNLADDSLYSAADSALRGKQIAEAIRLAELFPTRFASSPLLPLNDSLLGKALLARGDETQASDLVKAQADFQRAAQLFQNVMASSMVPRTKTQARVLLSRAERRLNHPDNVVEALTPIYESIKSGEAGSADHADVLPTLGEALLDVGQSNQAEAVLTQALQLLPADSLQRPTTLMKLAEVQAALAKWPEMETTLDQLAKSDPTGELVTQSAYANADRAIAKKDWSAAQKLLERVIAQGEAGRHYIVALTDLGVVQATQGRHALAAEAYRKVVESKTTDNEALAAAAYNLGICLEQDAGDDATKLASAADVLTQAAQKFAIPKDKVIPDAVEQKLALQSCKSARRAAIIRVKLKDFPAADELWQLTYDQIGKLQPGDQERERPDALLYEWAGSLFNGGNAARADELLTKLYQTYPTSEHADDARLFVAQGHDQAERKDEARQLYKTFENDTAATPETRQAALKSWMNFEVRMKNWDESQRLAGMLIQAFGNTPLAYDARFCLGEAQVQKGDFKGAAKTLSELRSDPGLPAQASWRPDLELLWAETQLRDQEYDTVRTVLNALVQSNPSATHIDQAREKLGRADLRQALFDEARKHWELVTNSPASAKGELAAKCQLGIAESYLTQKNYDKAILAYQKLYVNYKLPEYQAPALLQMGKCEITIKDWSGAKTTLDSLLKEFPESAEAKQAAQDLEVVKRNLPASDTPE